MSRTPVVVDPEQGRALVETLIRAHRDLGRPDRVQMIVAHQVTKRTRSAFSTQVVQHAVMSCLRIHFTHSALKQYVKDGRVLRTETMINNAADLGSCRARVLVAALVAAGHAINVRLLQHEAVSQDCFTPLEEVRRRGQSTVEAQGQRAAAWRWGDERVLARLAAIAQCAHLPRGLSNRTVRHQVAALLGDPPYSSAQMAYDVRRLRLTGLLERVPPSHPYVLSALGIKVSPFYTKLYTRLFRPGLAALEPPPCVPGALARALTAVADEIDGLVIAAQLGRPSAS